MVTGKDTIKHEPVFKTFYLIKDTFDKTLENYHIRYTLNVKIN